MVCYSLKGAIEQDLERLENLEVTKKVQCLGCSNWVWVGDYLGYLIDAVGLHTTPEKVAAIVNTPEPKNTTELQSFLGVVNYYGMFVKKNLSSTVETGY